MFLTLFNFFRVKETINVNVVESVTAVDSTTNRWLPLQFANDPDYQVEYRLMNKHIPSRKLQEIVLLPKKTSSVQLRF